MKKGIRFRGMLAAAVLAGSCAAARAQSAGPQAPQPITVRINVNQTAPPISKYEFGMFIEHIGPLIYRSLWSEMLDDRKFYFPITSTAPEAARPGGFRGMLLRRWVPVGPDAAVVMDKDEPFVGGQSPRIVLTHPRR